MTTERFFTDPAYTTNRKEGSKRNPDNKSSKDITMPPDNYDCLIPQKSIEVLTSPEHKGTIYPEYPEQKRSQSLP